MIKKFDFLIIGSGVAGMSYALKVSQNGKYKVALVCKTSLEESNTSKAQGGIASVTNLLVDNFEKHIEDTMIAGDYISDPAAVEQVVKGGPEGIADLVKWGVNFDKKENGEFDLEMSLKLYEEGVGLVAFCNKTLNGAKQKITELSEISAEDDINE